MELTNNIKESHRYLSKCSEQFLDYVWQNQEIRKAVNFKQLDLNDPLQKLQAWPVFINLQTRREIERAGREVLNLIKSIPSRFFNNDAEKIGSYYGIGTDLAQYLLSGVTEQHIDNLLSRGDFIFTQTGLKCLEFNINSNLGGMNIALWESLYLKNPLISDFLGQQGIKVCNKSIDLFFFEHLLASASRFYLDRGEINIAVVMPQGLNNPLLSSYRQYLHSVYSQVQAQRGGVKGDLEICDYSGLQVKGDDVLLKSKKIHYLVEWCQGYVPLEIQTLFKEGKVLISNGPVAILLSAKSNLSLLSENQDGSMFTLVEQETIKKYIPWTRNVLPGYTTYKGERVNLREFLLENRQKLVLKPILGSGGRGVHIGCRTVQQEWEELVEAAMVPGDWREIKVGNHLSEGEWYEIALHSFNVQNWLVQEYVESPPYLFQNGDEGCMEHHMVWGFFIFGETYAGGEVRVLPANNGKGVINGHQGAEVGAILEVNESGAIKPCLGLKNGYIGLMANDSPELFVGMLGILKSGHTFVPINPIFPVERIRFIVEDCCIQVLLTDRANYDLAREIARIAASIRRIVCIDDLVVENTETGKRTSNERASESQEKTGSRVDVEAANVASLDQHVYVIYTSGSTGRPKGVPITHRNLLPLFYWFNEYFVLGSHTRVMQNLSYTFDFGVFEILTTLLFGGRIYTIDKQAVLGFRGYGEFINKHCINTLHTTPVFFSNISAAGIKMPYLQLLHLGGERLTSKIMKRAAAVVPGNCKIYNGYGPTEASINCSIFCLLAGSCNELSEGFLPPIGRPTAKNEIFVLDKSGAVQPVGVPGELCIAGIGLAAGYLNRPQLTAEKFISHPFKLGEKIYKSGDLVRWLSSGDLVFLGRIDQQVKIRGFRIELGEIESCLSKHPDVKEVVVIAREPESGTSFLCAYFVSSAGEVVPGSRLKRYLSGELPEYMSPAFFIQMEQIPLNVNGKTDMKALPAPDEVEVETGAVIEVPETATQAALLSIWQSILPVEKIGIGDDFFDLGGDSLLVNQCTARIREEMLVEIPLRTFFERPYIKELALEIESRNKKMAAIVRYNREGEIPLSFAQERLWFIQELDAENVAYFVPRVIRIKGRLEKGLLERSFTEIIRRHEILRTVFYTVDGIPVQRVKAPYDFEIPVLDWMGVDESEQGWRVDEWVGRESRRPFDFENGPLLRVTLLKLKVEEHVLVLTEHHLVHDGWTQGVLLREFITIFTAYLAGEVHALPDLPIQYADFVIWQREMLQGEVLAGHLSYWREKLAGLAPVLELPVDRPRPVVNKGQGDMKLQRLPAQLSHSLREFSRKNGVTLFMAMLAVLKTLLYRYTGETDLCVGTGVANRKYKEMEGMLGMVVNTLPLRTQVDGALNFRENLLRVKRTCLEAYEHEDTPFEKIVEVLQPERSLSYSPLFQVMFSFLDTPTDTIALPGLDLHLEETHNRSSKFDISIVVVTPREQVEDDSVARGGEILIEWEYNTAIFDEETAVRMFACYNRLLDMVINNPSNSISGLPLLEDVEIEQLLSRLNGTKTDFPESQTLHGLFGECALKFPGKIALKGRGQGDKGNECQLSYRTLNERADQLAVQLMRKGVKPGDVVALMQERTLDLIAGLLAVLKTGAAYLPIDPDYPGERTGYMLADTNAIILLTTGMIYNQKETVIRRKWQGEVIDTTGLPGSYEYPMEPAVLPGISNQFPAYIIYTSGSTGRPKGVLVGHSSVVNLVFFQVKEFNFGFDERVLQFSSICFDASVEQIFISLLNGSQLVLVEKEKLINPHEFEAFILSREITHIHAVPSFLSTIKLGGGSQVKRVIAGGDVCPVSLAEKWRKYCDFYNEYGPTETTVTSIELRVNDFANNLGNLYRIPIGRPVGNTTVYLFDRYMQLVPIGVMGELYIGGRGVAYGYLNRPELTGEKFIINPYVKGERLYRTGDLARWTNSGHLEFLGRMDSQVKIRGFRIELEEIENCLAKQESVSKCIVVDRSQEPGEKYLCAYVVVEKGKMETGSVLSDFLRRVLPEYMIPAFFIFIDKIPLTPNGKVDRDALPHPGEIAAGEPGEAILPANEIEMGLAQIWADILDINCKGIGMDENFFQLGGHSLKAGLLVARIHKEFDIKVPLTEIFFRPSLRQLAGYIRAASREKFTSIELATKKPYYSLSPAQTRLYVLQRMNEKSIGYNIPMVLILEGQVNKKWLEDIFWQMLQRHESLRTSFITRDDVPVQEINETVDFSIGYYSAGSGEGSSIAALVNSFILPFDLSRAPLLRVILLEEGPGQYVLIVDMHHIITDGISLEIFASEFMSLYNGEQLPALRLQYKDYSEWQNRRIRMGLLDKEEKYWLNLYQEMPPPLELPRDFPRPAFQSFAGREIFATLTPMETATLKEMALSEGATLYMVMLSLYFVFIARLCNQEDIVVGTPVAGRNHTELQGLMGMFVNTLALRNFVRGETRFLTFLAEVKKRTLDALEHQEYQYEELVDKVFVNRDTSRNPLFDTMFSLQNQEINEIKIPGLKLKPFPYNKQVAKLDLSFYGAERNGELNFGLEFCTNLFKEETVQVFLRYFKEVVARVIGEPDVRISELALISEEERQQILQGFNDTAAGYPRAISIQEIFEKQVVMTPDWVALSGNRYSLALSYGELNRQANRLAWVLEEKGVRPGFIVGIMIERSWRMIAAILAILKTGCAYLPIDPGYPWERVRYMLADSNALFLLSNTSFTGDIPFAGFIDLDEVFRSPGNDPAQSIEAGYVTMLGRPPAELAYVIYTSGSTGFPKGVAIRHQNVINLFKAMDERLGFVPSRLILALTTISFDIFLVETLLALVTGMRIILANEVEQTDPVAISKLLVENDIDILQVTPSRLSLLLNYNEKLSCLARIRTLIVGGEPFPGNLFNILGRYFPGKVYNMYGPTETTVYSTLKELSGVDKITIGKPLANTQIYILDRFNQVQPTGIAGELWIGGDGVAVGYLNNVQLTVDKFLPNPFASILPSDENQLARSGSQRIYRTGDLARWLADGEIEFLGRIDFQVKIRGFRIELAEIERALLNHKWVKEAVVLPQGNKAGDRYLCAYIVPVEGVPEEDIRPAVLVEYLSQSLPYYMIPSFFVFLKQIPLTRNGKIDRAAFPDPKVEEGQYTAPRSHVEKELMEIWSEVLGIERENTGIDSNFFSLGGHSLKAVLLISKIQHRFNITFTLGDIFKIPTIRGIASLINTIQRTVNAEERAINIPLETEEITL